MIWPRRSKVSNEPKEIEPRPLSEREAGWISDILQVNDEWRNADISRTQVVAEGPCDEGVCIRLQAPESENPKAKSRRESVGELWIQTDDGCSINVQLSQFEGRLQELYLLFVDPKLRTRKLPETWNEVSREATDI
ncbi:hypothetical protein BDD14_6566 [Edaphobacter modestus]|uniref:Uncharacterized protein n=1 Tax=Edaphobacter modestus TaxID=388466 RepID=A0A4Q7XXF9_9BACT|nr:hypothetical protein BDD14_6566 [Edaphobacter modestus]